MLVSFLNWLTFFWLLFLALTSIHRIVKGDRSSVDWVIPVLFLFCGLPLMFDEVMGRPGYAMQPGFFLASSDEATNILYCLYISIGAIFLLWVGRFAFGFSKSVKRHVPYDTKRYQMIKTPNFKSRLVLYALLVSPVIMVLLSPDPGQYLIFTDTLRFSDYYQEAHIGIALACNLSVLAGIFLLTMGSPSVYGRWPSMKTVLTTMPWVLIAIWIHGKRTIAAVAGLLLILALQYRGVLRGMRVYFLASIVFIGIISYSFFFQGYTGRVSSTWYENARIDYGRDDKIKMTIYAELHPEIMKILEYRGQSLLFYLTAFIPREVWPEKPLPYAQYFTSAMFLAEPRLWGWGMTTSWLEEAVANLGWFGMLIGPLLIGLMCRVGDASQNDFTRMLTPLMASLMLVVQAAAFLPLLSLWLLLVFFERVRSIRFV